ncbi:hypothetical protein [Halonotius roseus]|uniref:Uncharacterized protein n=1 Tax=Halonotius roseus TaxID=2511997 RepID=A0A544QL44_9EURY|nr:hypothetical protein [Halonotius roseus]TQQ79038.1 hypothetical protein EWF95_12980 [Halonotius roseus]
MGIQILDGLSSWVREQVGPEADNRGEAANEADGADDSEADIEEADTDDDADDTDTDAGDSDAPACCSAAGNTDVTVVDP